MAGRRSCSGSGTRSRVRPGSTAASAMWTTRTACSSRSSPAASTTATTSGFRRPSRSRSRRSTPGPSRSSRRRWASASTPGPRCEASMRGVLALVLAVCACPLPALRPAPAAAEGKAGGVLRLVLREDLPQGFAIHESATNSVTWPAMPCYSNLVIFDQQKQLERTETIVPELAERWSWQDNYRNLVFFLRRGVKWHDGQPFTSKDVKFTFDVVREAKDAPTKLRLNPRKEWYGNIDAIEAPDPFTVVFRLKRPQPSLLNMLASGYSPVLPAHVPLAEHRSRCIGTGPFKFKEWKRGESVELVRNPDYFVKGRPYLDGIRFVIIVERGTRMAALQAGQVDVAYPGDTTVDIAERLKAAVPRMVFTEVSTNVSENLLINTARPPLDDVKVRLAP